MTATVTTPNSENEPVFLWGPGYELTAHQIVDALGSYLATFGDTLGPGGVSPLDAIHAEVVHGTDLTAWREYRTAHDIAVIRARAETIARDCFHDHFPALAW